MKKIVLLMFVMLFSTSLVVGAALYESKANAISSLQADKIVREANIDKTLLDVTYTTNKICDIDYDTEIPSCHVCFSYVANGINVDDCVGVFENSATEEIDAQIKNAILERIDIIYPKESYTYEELSLVNRVISIKTEKTAVIIEEPKTPEGEII